MGLLYNSNGQLLAGSRGFVGYSDVKVPTNIAPVSGLASAITKATAPPVAPTLKAHIISSFSGLDAPGRQQALAHLQSMASQGNKDAATKLSYLTPLQHVNVPTEPNFGTKGVLANVGQGIASSAYNLGKGVVQSGINDAKTIGDLPVVAGQSIAHLATGDVKGAAQAQRNSYIGKTYGTKAPGDTSGLGNAVSFALDLGGLKGGGAVAKELGKEALVKTAAKGAATGAAYGAGYGVAQTAQNNQHDLKSTLTNIGKNAAAGAVLGGGLPVLARGVGAAAKMNADNLTEMKNAAAPGKGLPDPVATLNEKIGQNQILTGIRQKPGLKDTLNGEAAPTSVNPATRELLVNKTTLRGDLDHLAKGGAIDTPYGTIVRQSGETASAVQDRYLNDLVKFEESHVANATVGDVQDWRNGNLSGQQLDQRALDQAKPEAPVEQTTDEAMAEPSKSDAQIAATARQAFTGIRNSESVMGAQVKDQVDKLAPGEQNAVMWYREAGGDVNKLKDWAADPDKLLDPHRADIEAATHLSAGGKHASAVLDDYYNQAGQRALDTGAINNIREDYNNARLYKQEPVNTINSQAGQTLRNTTGHAKERVYNTVYDAVKSGKVPATTDAGELASIHSAELGRVNATRELQQSLSDAGLGQHVMGKSNVPEGWSIVSSKSIPATDAEGNAIHADQHFIAPAPIANRLKALTDNGRLNGTVASGLRKYQGLVKSYDLSFSFFHHMTFAAQAVAESARHPLTAAKTVNLLAKDGVYNAMELDAVKHGLETARVHQNLDILGSLRNDQTGLAKTIGNLPGLKQVNTLIDKNNHLLFGKAQSYLKVQDYAQQLAVWIGRHPEATDTEVVAAKRAIASHVNKAYGGLNWEAMGITKTARQGMQGALLAPDWLISNLGLLKDAGTKWNLEGHLARANLATSVVGAAVLTEMANKAITGHYTNQNPASHEFEVEIAPHVYVSLFRGALGELVKLGSNIIDNGPIAGVARYLESKGSPVSRTAVGLLSNTNYYGQALTKASNGAVKNTGAELSFGAQNLLPAPFGAVGAYKYATSGESTLPGALATATGVGRYTAPSGSQRRLESETPAAQQEMKSLNVTLQQPKQTQRGQKLSPQQYKTLVSKQDQIFNTALAKAMADPQFRAQSAAEQKSGVKQIESNATKQAIDAVLGKAAKRIGRVKTSKYTKN